MPGVCSSTAALLLMMDTPLRLLVQFVFSLCLHGFLRCARYVFFCVCRFKESPQFKTGHPVPGQASRVPPLELDVSTLLPEPFSVDKVGVNFVLCCLVIRFYKHAVTRPPPPLSQWLSDHTDQELMFDSAQHETQLRIVRHGGYRGSSPAAPNEAWLWQYVGLVALLMRQKKPAA